MFDKVAGVRKNKYDPRDAPLRVGRVRPSLPFFVLLLWFTPLYRFVSSPSRSFLCISDLCNSLSLSLSSPIQLHPQSDLAVPKRMSGRCDSCRPRIRARFREKEKRDQSNGQTDRIADGQASARAEACELLVRRYSRSEPV